ncbi:hypothetical protein BASA61_004331 [Batrachochytrium salamandrivorans]|nr:hypothetical protein BASA61_004331 [Batrachochytrium salamandrivorans]
MYCLVNVTVSISVQFSVCLHLAELVVEFSELRLEYSNGSINACALSLGFPLRLFSSSSIKRFNASISSSLSKAGLSTRSSCSSVLHITFVFLFFVFVGGVGELERTRLTGHRALFNIIITLGARLTRLTPVVDVAERETAAWAAIMVNKKVVETIASLILIVV